jgi:hypothetical protein
MQPSLGFCGNIGESVERVFSQEQVTRGMSDAWDERDSIRFSARLELEPLWVSEGRSLAVFLLKKQQEHELMAWPRVEQAGLLGRIKR